MVIYFRKPNNYAVYFSRILQECHKVFYKQLLSWILQGNLHDPYQEFFIGCVEDLNCQVSTPA